jgi:hypothetical protein
LLRSLLAGPAFLLSLTILPAHAAEPGPLAGSWTQHSGGTELVFKPKIKIMPSISATGFVIGTTGSGGSQTATTIHNEFSPALVDRTMTLDIEADGSFRWVIDKDRATSEKKPDCRSITREEKLGAVQVSGNQVQFVINGGSSAFKDSCDASRALTGPGRQGQETYNFAVDGNTLLVTGSGGVRWVFERH